MDQSLRCFSWCSCAGPRHVVTAAHCVFDINASRQYVSSLNFAPGQSNANMQPYGSVDWASVRVLSQFTSQVSADWELYFLPSSIRLCKNGSLSSCHVKTAEGQGQSMQKWQLSLRACMRISKQGVRCCSACPAEATLLAA